MGLGKELSMVGIDAISTSVLGLLCKDRVWLGRVRLACREVRVFSLWNLAVGGAQGRSLVSPEPQEIYTHQTLLMGLGKGN